MPSSVVNSLAYGSNMSCKSSGTHSLNHAVHRKKDFLLAPMEERNFFPSNSSKQLFLPYWIRVSHMHFWKPVLVAEGSRVGCSGLSRHVPSIWCQSCPNPVLLQMENLHPVGVCGRWMLGKQQPKPSIPRLALPGSLRLQFLPQPSGPATRQHRLHPFLTLEFTHFIVNKNLPWECSFLEGTHFHSTWDEVFLE